jgi:multiple sugar transport system substrate-binding protein
MRKLLSHLTTLTLLGAASLGLAQEKTVLTIASWSGNDALIESVLPGFLETHPDVEVQVVGGLGYGDYHPALNNRLNSGTAEDVISLGNDVIVEYALGDFFENLAAAPYNMDSSIYTQSQVANATGPDGRIIAVPNDAGPTIMYYRSDLFEAAGLDINEVTASWENYIAAGQKLKEQGVFLSSGPGEVASTIWSTNLPEGEGVFFDAEGNVLVGNERFMRGFTLGKEIRDAGIDVQTEIPGWTPEWFEAFGDNKIASIITGSWFETTLKTQADPEGSGRWAVAIPPENSTYINGGAYYAINAASPNKELAWELAQYLTEREAQIAIFKQSGNFPANLTILDDPAFSEPQEYFGGQAIYEVYREAASSQKPVPSNKNFALAQSIIGTAFDSVINEGADIETAMADAKSLIERRSSR